MWITKTESTAVKDVRVWEDTKPRVSVNFAQNLRFSMFVSQQGNPLAAVAVESADYELGDIAVRNTFLQYNGSEISTSTKPASAPAILSNLMQPISQVKVQQVSEHQSQSSKTAESAKTESLDGSFHLQGGDLYSEILYSTVHETFSSDVKSLGSLRHGQSCSPCRFQYFHQTDPQTHDPCRNGKLCGLCHDFHSEEYVRRAKNHSHHQRRRHKRKLTTL